MSSWLTSRPPSALIGCSLVFVNNLMAELTYYGTTTSLVIFVEDHVTFPDWWRVGLYASVLSLAIWLPVGMPWWKFFEHW